MGNAKYYAKWFFGAICLGIVLDSWSGANALTKTGFSGFSGLATSLKAKPAAGG